MNKPQEIISVEVPGSKLIHPRVSTVAAQLVRSERGEIFLQLAVYRSNGTREVKTISVDAPKVE